MIPIAKDTRTRNWWFVCYPESAPSDWVQQLDDLHVQYCISPLHEYDVDSNGEVIKAHYHVVLVFDSVKSYSQIVEITAKLHQPIPQPVQSLIGTIRYLIHKDNPDKFQYNAADLRCGGGFNAKEYLERPADIRATIAEIYGYIKENDVTEFSELCDYAFVNEPDWFDVLTAGHTIFFTAILTSRRNRKKNIQENE